MWDFFFNDYPGAVSTVCCFGGGDFKPIDQDVRFEPGDCTTISGKVGHCSEVRGVEIGDFAED